MSSNSDCNHTRDKQIGIPLRGRPIFFITRTITDRIGLHSVLLPLLIRKLVCDREYITKLPNGQLKMQLFRLFRSYFFVEKLFCDGFQHPSPHRERSFLGGLKRLICKLVKFIFHFPYF